MVRKSTVFLVEKFMSSKVMKNTFDVNILFKDFEETSHKI